MPIGTGIIYNVGDLILSQVSGSGTAFLETKIAAATSSLIYFDSTAKINSASLNSITVGTASYVSGSRSIITNLTASNISASGTSSFGYVGIGTTSPNDLLQLQASSSIAYDATSDNGQYGSGAGITITNMDETSQSFAQVNLQVSGNAGRALGRIVAIRTASATSDLAFVTENANTKAEKMRILSDGNVGIGTTAPGARLEVYGTSGDGIPTFKVTSTAAASTFNWAGTILNSSLGSSRNYILLIGKAASSKNSGYIGYNHSGIDGSDTNFLTFGHYGSDNLLNILGNGNVGIGTTSPAAKLHVVGDEYVTGNVTIGLTSNYSNLNFIRNGGSAVGGVGWRSDGYFYVGGHPDYGPSAGNDVRVRGFGASLILGTNSTDYVYLNTSGNLGIGTTSPTGSLQVNKASQTLGATTPSGATIISNLAGGNGILELGVDTTNLAYIQSRNITDQTYYKLLLNPSGGSVGIGTSSPGALLEISSSTAASLLNVKGAGGNAILFVSGSGNVGIGTTSPVYPLEVSSTAILSIAYQRTGVSAKKWGFDSDNSNTYWINLTDSVRSFTLSNAGNVGIGVGIGNPAYTLDVRGDLRISGSGSTVGTFKSSASSCFISLIDSSNDNVFLGNDDGDFLIQTPTTSYSTKLIVKDDGNVGIGTTSPATNLEIYKSVSVAGESYQDILTVTTVDNDGGYFYTGLGAGIAFRSGKTSANVYGPSIMGSIYGANSGDESIANGYLSFHTRNSNTVAERMRITNNGNVGIGTTNPAATLQVAGNISGSSFTSSISNAVGFLGTSSWASNAVTSLVCTGNAATATTASYANALNAANSYTVVDVNTTGNIRLRNGDPTITLSDTNDSSSFIHVDGNYFSILCGPPNASFGEWVVPANGRWPMEISLTNNTSTFGGSLDAISFTGSGSGLFGTAAGLSIGGTAATASYANALNTGNSYTISGLTNNSTLSQQGTLSMGSGYQILATTGTAPIPGISFVGDTNTGIYAPSADTLGFSISGSERVRIASDGNVGIGTTSPATILQVVGTGVGSFGTINIRGEQAHLGLTTSGGTFKGWYGYYNSATHGSDLDLNIKTGYDGASNIRIAANGDTSAAHVFISGSGNVGIGTTSPGTLLNIHGANPFVRINNTAADDHGIKISYNNSETHGFNLIYNANSAISYIDNTYPTSSGQVYGDIYFRQNVAGTMTTRMTIKADGGNVGIGASNPSYKLHVYGSSPELVVHDSGANGTRLYTKATNTAVFIGATYGSNAVPINFTLNGGSTTSMLIDANSNVGIGVTPTVIIGASGVNGKGLQGDSWTISSLQGTDESYFGNNLYSSAYNVWSNRVNSASGAYYITGGTHIFLRGAAQAAGTITPTESMRITSTGAVGIGLTNPNTKLQVSGSATIGGYNAFYFGTGVTSLNITAPLYPVLAFYYGTNFAGTVGGYSDHIGLNTGAGASKYISFEPGDSEIMRITAAGNVGIGTSTPLFKLDNYNDTFRSLSRVSEKIVSVGFDNAIANQKVDITFDVTPGTNVFWGNLEVEITDGYNHQNATGKLIKVFAVGLNPATGAGPYGSAIFDNSSYYTAAYGAVVLSWAIDGIFFNTTTGKYYFTVIHRTSTGNSPVIKIKGYTVTPAHSDSISKLTAGSVYTTDTTVYYQPVVETAQSRIGYNGNVNQSGDLIVQGNVGIGTTSPNVALDVNGSIHLNGNIRNVWGDNLFNVTQHPSNSSTSPNYYMGFQTEASTRIFYISNKNDDGSATDPNGGIMFRTGGTPTNRMLISYSGNVGIGTTSPAAKLSVNGVSSFGLSSKLSMIGLDINSGVTPTYVKIVTTIPFASTAADFTVNIKGFIYGSQRAADISICWHYYNSTFYGAIAKSSGGWAPTIRLSAEGGFVAIVLSSPGYWPKFYVESMYSSAYNNQYVSDWSWVDADATGSPIVNVSYASNFGNSFVMLDNGNVGINQTSPTTPLHVVGVISGSSFTGAGTGLTGTAASLTAGAVTNGVYTTGAQSVGGVKSFTSTMNVTGVRETMTTVAAATNVAINLNLGTIFKLTFSSTVSTFTITNTDNTNVAAGNSFTLISAPDNSNAKTIAFSFITNGAAATAVKWATFAGGTTPTATITSGKFDVFSFVYDGVNWYGFTGGLTY